MTKTINGHEIIQLFEQFSPKSLAVEGDKIGLQIGTLNKTVANVMVTLDVLEETVDEAIAKNVDLIIAHHPPVFRPLKHVITDQPGGRLIEKCIKHDIAVYAAHTNLDVADGGVNDMLAEALELKNTKVLVPTYEEPLKKLAVYVPKDYEEQVRTALGDAGAGHIGAYSHCAFSAEGVGSFKPLSEADPFIGKRGELERVEEVRIETVYPAGIEKSVIKAMSEAHPYEEVAFDIYPVEQNPLQKGLGRIGELNEEMTLEAFARYVKEKLEKTRCLKVLDPSNLLPPSSFLLPRINIDYPEALKYLRGEALVLPADTPRGIVNITYKGIVLGPAKNIGNRANNLYPKAWRIKTTHLPAEEVKIIDIQ